MKVYRSIDQPYIDPLQHFQRVLFRSVMTPHPIACWNRRRLNGNHDGFD
jgi:hypothetical protein